MKKNLLTRIALGGLGVGAVALWKLVVAPTLAVKAENALGVGWNDARPELVATFGATLAEHLASLSLTPAEAQTVTECCADKAVEFLNATDCSYQYNTATQSEAEHLAEQEACFARVKYEEATEKSTLGCMIEKMPNDWKLLRSGLIENFAKGATSEGMPEAQATKVATCFADRVVAKGNEKKCPVLNREAKTADDMFLPMEKCISDEESKAIGEACATAP